MMVGTMTMTTPAIKPTQSPVYSMPFDRVYKPSERVLLFGSLRKTYANWYSFHRLMKLKIAAVIRPGRPRGSMTRKKT